jgi:hypothetical protein
MIFFANAAGKQRFNLKLKPCWTHDDMSTMNCVHLYEIFNGLFIDAKNERHDECSASPAFKGNRHKGWITKPTS